VSKTIPNLLAVMTPFPHSIDAGENLATARTLMEHHGIGQLPVTSEGKLVGVLLEHQLRRNQRAEDPEPQETVLRVGDVCSSAPYVAQVSEQLDNVLMEMSRRRASCVLVLRNDKLAGILTSNDVCRLLAEQLRAPFAGASPLDDEPA
jgi:acetoin utilization protein AcuB